MKIHCQIMKYNPIRKPTKKKKLDFNHRDTVDLWVVHQKSTVFNLFVIRSSTFLYTINFFSNLK